MVLQHRTEIELRAEPTHEGTNDIITAIIDKLGELTHGCALITGCKLSIDWVAGGTYQTHLEHVDIHDTCIDPDGEEKKENFRMTVTKWINNYIEFKGAGIVFESDLEGVLGDMMSDIVFNLDSTKYPDFFKDIKAQWTLDEFNWFCNGMNLKYRLKPSQFEGRACYEFVDTTKEDNPSQ